MCGLVFFDRVHESQGLERIQCRCHFGVHGRIDLEIHFFVQPEVGLLFSRKFGKAFGHLCCEKSLKPFRDHSNNVVYQSRKRDVGIKFLSIPAQFINNGGSNSQRQMVLGTGIFKFPTWRYFVKIFPRLLLSISSISSLPF